MCGGANDSHFVAWPCSEIYLWGSKMSEIGSVRFYYKALTFYLQNIECADATPHVKPSTPPHLFAWFFREMSCKISFWGGVTWCNSHFILQFSALTSDLPPRPLFPSSPLPPFPSSPVFISGFVGSDCEINYDECVHGYCANNSTCIDLVADYDCVCPPGFAGELSMSSFS